MKEKADNKLLKQLFESGQAWVLWVLVPLWVIVCSLVGVIASIPVLLVICRVQSTRIALKVAAARERARERSRQRKAAAFIISDVPTEASLHQVIPAAVQ